MRRKFLIAGVVVAVALPIIVWTALVELYSHPHAAATPVASAPARPATAKLYVANAFGDDVEAFDLGTGQPVARIAVGKLPHNLAVGPDGKVYVAVAGAQAIAAIDPARDQLVASRIVGDVPDNPAHRAKGLDTVRAAASCNTCHAGKVLGSFPAAIAPMPDGRLCVTELEARELALVERSSLATKRTVGIQNPAPSAPSNVVFHPTTHEAYVLSRPFDARDAASPTDVGPSTAPFAHEPPAGHGWLTVYDADLRVLRWRLELPHGGPFGAVFAPDGKLLYVSCRAESQVLAIDVEKHVVNRTFEVADNPVGLALVPPDTLAVACYGARPGVVQLLDRHTGKQTGSVEVGPNPAQLTRDPASGRLYASVSGANGVVEIDPVARKVLRSFRAGAAPVGLAVVR